MFRILIIAAIIGLIAFRWYWKRAKNAAERKRLVRNSLLWGLSGTIILLAATGRIHWLGAVFAAMFPVLKFVFAALLRFFPALAQIYQNKQQNSENRQAPTPEKMSVAEAYEILGLKPGCSASEIRQSHKRLIRKLHPDRGGNDYLASRINQARDVLMENRDD